MPDAVDILLYAFLVISAVAFVFQYCIKEIRCNARFDGQLHCMSGIIVSNKPFFGFVMHGVAGMILLSVGLRIERGEGTQKEVSFLVMSLVYFSLSAVISFDVKECKSIHFASLFCLLVCSVGFVWLQCVPEARIAYTAISSFFVAVILFNFTCTRWKWPWMDVQAIVEIVWVISLLVCVIGFAAIA